MSTTLQIEANRRNATLSTGPVTPEGKATSASNSLRSGLFATHLNVRPAEAFEYEALRDGILLQIQPDGALEDSLALQLINAHWRLRRCDRAEAAIPALQNEATHDIHDFSNPAQKAIERARAAAENSIRRTVKDLKEMQAERWRRASLHNTGPIHPNQLGLAPVKEATAPVPSDDDLDVLEIRSVGMGLQNEPSPANNPKPDHYLYPHAA